MRRAQCALGLVDGRQKIISILSEVGRTEFSHPFEVALGAVGHDGEFGGDRREVFRGHGRTLDRVARRELVANSSSAVGRPSVTSLCDACVDT